jgi:hypothetical protein
VVHCTKTEEEEEIMLSFSSIVQEEEAASHTIIQSKKSEKDRIICNDVLVFLILDPPRSFLIE